MALSKLPDDVLLSIGECIYDDLQPAAYIVDFEARRRSFKDLVLVCRQLNAVITRLLYRTLCIRYEVSTWPAKYERLWYQQNSDRIRMANLLRTVNTCPTICAYTHRLELSWGDFENDSSEEHGRIIELLAKFPQLRELDLSASPFLPSNRDIWPLQLLQTNTSECLRNLRISQPFDPSLLPRLFFLPSIQTLEIATFDAHTIHGWHLPPSNTSRRSPVTHLSLAANLDSSQLLEVLSWPAHLYSFTYTQVGDGILDGIKYASAHSLTPSAFNVALRSFRPTLANLYIHLRDSYFGANHVITESFYAGAALHDSPPYLDLSLFPVLAHLHLPSYYIFASPHRNEYNRDTLASYLPSSLRTLAITFKRQDPIVPRDVNFYSFSLQYANEHVIPWLAVLASHCCAWGLLPLLESVRISDDRRTKPLYGTSVRQDDFLMVKVFKDAGVRLDVLMYDPRVEADGWWDGTPPGHGCTDGREYWDWLDFGPVVGREETEYSDSLLGLRDRWTSEWGEDAEVEELLYDEQWATFDRMMEDEWREKGRVWIKGQEPCYEETSERREELARWGTWLMAV